MANGVGVINPAASSRVLPADDFPPNSPAAGPQILLPPEYGYRFQTASDYFAFAALWNPAHLGDGHVIDVDDISGCGMALPNPNSMSLATSASPDSPPTKKTSSRDKSERDKRTYRACLHCRQRKSRCDLYSSGEPGRPPCERCIREQHECILGGSRRGGRRVKRSVSEATAAAAAASTSSGQHSTPGDFNNSAIKSGAVTDSSSGYSPAIGALSQPATSIGINPNSRMLPPLPQDLPRSTATPHGARLTVDEHVASTDLQNPADALEFLAHVAERDNTNHLPPMQSVFGEPGAQNGQPYHNHLLNRTASGSTIDFPPLTKGQLSLETIGILLRRYEERYHPFFPLANPSLFDMNKLAVIAAKEPHLLTAILTVASKDDKEWWQWHETCSSHMMQLIAELVYSGGGTVEAVEAMLILAEWVPRRPRCTPSVGRGEEDHAAWMYVGTAVRLGYLLGIDRTGFRAEADSNSTEINRKRLAWAACYMCDRQISVRIGKAFWSRGPGPMTALRAEDFPSLKPRPPFHDDFAAIFQANLELTQLFSNAHDVLYATKSRSNQLNFGGEYVKYIDDFRVALRNWNSTWGSFHCSPPLKASLIFSYEYLRVYVNAFAYQATLNRLAAQVQAATPNGQQPPPPFQDIAATPDARFIYDSIDAAQSLLSTFNSFIDPVETFRYMPLRYYLYVIYSACFLYKARSTGVMTGETRRSVRAMINDTADRLQQASACSNDVGERYSRLIRLLWRKPPQNSHSTESSEINRPNTAQPTLGQAGLGAGQQHGPNEMPVFDAINNPPSINMFSWLDLPAVTDFATQNNSISGSVDSFDRFEESSMDNMVFDPNLMMAQQYGLQAMSGSEIIF